MIPQLPDEERDYLIDRLRKGEPIPADFKYKLFPTLQKEYELVYAGKMRREDILADEDGVTAMPLQVEKVFNGTREKFADGWRNLMVFGDNLQFLKTLYADTDDLIRNRVKGQVKLIYIDPPFATASDFKSTSGVKAYTDKKNDSFFVEFLRRRLMIAQEILAEDGNIIVHLDSKKSHYIKLILDEVFGENNFINEIIWHKGREGGSSRSHSAGAIMPTEYQNMLVYAKNKARRYWYPILGPYKQSTVNGIERDNKGWYYSRGRMGRQPAEWEIAEGKSLKTYVSTDLTKNKEEIIQDITSDDARFVAIGDVWNKEFVKLSQTTGYPTEKPESLLHLLIEASTQPDDLVLDFFGGSGTTAAVAEKLGRRWITCDIGKLSFYTMQKRLLQIQDSKSLTNPAQKHGQSARTFATVNTGLYDLPKLFDLDRDKYRTFVLNLFEIDDASKSINGIRLDGERFGSYAMIWNFWDFRESQIDEDFLSDLHRSLHGRIGNRLYLIAPANRVGFISDYHEIEDVRYYFLKVPYQIIQELHKKEFLKFRQPQSKNKINELADAVGFHFMRQPKVESELVGSDLIIKQFASLYSEEGTGRDMANFESLSMVLWDVDYNGSEFVMTSFVFAADLIATKKQKQKDLEVAETEGGNLFVDQLRDELKHQTTLRISLGETGPRIGVVYVDIYGNEFREEFKRV